MYCFHSFTCDSVSTVCSYFTFSDSTVSPLPYPIVRLGSYSVPLLLRYSGDQRALWKGRVQVGEGRVAWLFSNGGGMKGGGRDAEMSRDNSDE